MIIILSKLFFTFFIVYICQKRFVVSNPVLNQSHYKGAKGLLMLIRSLICYQPPVRQVPSAAAPTTALCLDFTQTRSLYLSILSYKNRSLIMFVRKGWVPPNFQAGTNSILRGALVNPRRDLKQNNCNFAKRVTEINFCVTLP